MMLSLSNTKLVKTGKLHNGVVAAFDLPAGQTCPYAGACKKGCYAHGFTFLMHADKYANNYAVSQTDSFNELISAEISELRSKYKHVYIRIHSSGDFYSREYLAKWLVIIRSFPDVRFYCYTKSVGMLKSCDIPSNFTVTYSYGGMQDMLIKDTDNNARVFKNEEDCLKAGYTIANNDDLIMLTRSKVGLIYHGSKKFENTDW